MSDLRESEITNVNLKIYEPRVQGNMKSYEGSTYRKRNGLCPNLGNFKETFRNQRWLKQTTKTLV